MIFLKRLQQLNSFNLNLHLNSNITKRKTSLRFIKIILNEPKNYFEFKSFLKDWLLPDQTQELIYQKLP